MLHVSDGEPVCRRQRVVRNGYSDGCLRERLTDRLRRARWCLELHHCEGTEANKDESGSHLISRFQNEILRPKQAGQAPENRKTYC